jgi:DNA-binding transcriptional MerR regulator
LSEYTKALVELSGGFDVADFKAKRTFKDSLICSLFNEREAMAELCHCFSPVDEIFEAEDIDIATLQNIFFTGRKNDFSCLAKNKYFKFFAHQSSKCGNLPLRELMYAAREYENYAMLKLHELDPAVSLDTAAQAIYSSVVIKLPTPHFICLSEADVPEVSEASLADAFFDPVEGAKNLNLTMKIYNIKPGNNVDIIAKSPVLNAYCVFSSTVKAYIAFGDSTAEAIRKGIRYFIDNDYLPDFFAEHSSEVSRLFAEDLSLQKVNELLDSKTSQLLEEKRMRQEEAQKRQEAEQENLQLKKELEKLRKRLSD